MDFKDRLRLLREERRWTQTELAERLFTTFGNVSKYENGRVKPPMEVLIKMADLFNVSVDYLLGLNSQAPGSVPVELPAADRAAEAFKEVLSEAGGEKSAGYAEGVRVALQRFPNLPDSDKEEILAFIRRMDAKYASKKQRE